ncbi:MAG: glycerophosphodiester phosphodiesterase [Gammaproteobacteria bacterium]|nr:glycerophosphodiester phosphodiesterase [Gammaproteobacteria bacterium]
MKLIYFIGVLMLSFIAHRGASAYAPENTMAAFLLAHEMGASSIECDVILTADKVPVIIHDNHLARTTNGKDKVNTRDYAYIESLDAGSWFHPQFKGCKVPRLSELLLWQKQTGIELNLEIKPIHLKSFEADLDIILHQVHEYADTTKFKILSFQYKIFQRLQVLNNKLATALEVSYCTGQTISAAVEAQCQQINMSYRYLSGKRIKAIHQAGLKAGVYTVNHLQQLKKIEALDLDEVFTDDLKLIEGFKKSCLLGS